jgi:protein arginine kinase activator
MQLLLKRIHGADKHCGKDKVELGEVLLPEEELALLQQKLQEAVAREDFERAVQVRDQIRSVELAANEEKRR